MSTLTEIKLSSHLREELISKLSFIWIETLSDDIESIVLDGFTGLKHYTDHDLLMEYEHLFCVDVLDSSSDERTNDMDDFVSKLKLDIAANRMLYE